MGTRQVYEEKLRRESLHHDPTIRPERCEWEITPVLHDVIAVAVSGVGAMLSAVHGFNTGIPYVQQYLKGTKWFPLVIGV
ncbi:hypothetical protein CDL12_29274 [Handroanthus impetiginosus]|uniref:Uncharacterized protein n=1 Tax=Handroanthus impetiginosus TaxID=429701 RepID=A0A2G9FYX3_9LAMI|nr:hypothetical protein CDL12_29274 [Handroanthus impetiginosus]